MARMPALLSLIAGLLLLIFMLPNFGSAVQSFECQQVWKGPSADNDFFACFQDRDRLKNQWRHFVLPSFNGLLFLVTLISFPLLFICVLCCRNCCCTPDTKGTSERARCCIWLWIIYALLWSFATFLLVVFGAKMLIRTAPILMDDTLTGPLDYFNRTAEKIIDFTSDWSTGERKPIDAIPLDLNDFSTVHAKSTSVVENAKEYYFKYLDWISIATYIVGSIGFVLIILIIPFACWHCCIPCFPLVISCLYWVCAVIFSLLGVLVTVLAYFSAVSCGELELQYKRQPGVFQWYAVPYCKREFNFKKINEEIRLKELELSKKACQELLKKCDNDQNDSLSENVKGGKLKLPSSLIGLLFSDDQELNNATEMKDDQRIYSSTSSQFSKVIPDTSTLYSSVETRVSQNGITGINKASQSETKAKLEEALQKEFGNNSSILKDFKIPDELPKGFDLNTDLKDIVNLLKKNKSFLLYPLSCGKSIKAAEDCKDFGTMANVLFSTKVKSFTGACPGPDSSCTLEVCAENCTNDFVKKVAIQVVDVAKMASNASIALSYARPLLECNFVLDKLASAFSKCSDIKTGSLMLGLGFFIGGLMFGLSIYIALRGACIWGELPAPLMGRKRRSE